MFLFKICAEGVRKTEHRKLTDNEGRRDFTRELGRAVTCLYRSRSKFMGEHLRDSGFSGVMYMILLHLEHHPGATQDQIASHMYIDKCNVARRTKKLEELGYIRREIDQTDRRQNNLTLTEKGRDLVPIIKTYLSAWGAGISEDLSDEEKGQLINLLSRMTGQNKR